MCYAYLCDVPSRAPNAQDVGRSDIDHWVANSRFRKSAWFTRGWTLQELLAPDTVIFLDCRWFEIGTKLSLERLISSITGIDCLLNFREACIAQKMSWASKRETLREEDMAYSLMGLFNVHMPLLYGEGKHAFHRLQLEILKVSQDESIFAWTENKPYYIQRGLLARSPANFIHSGDVILGSEKRRTPYYMTNAGLQIDLVMYRSLIDDGSRSHELFELRRQNLNVEQDGEPDIAGLPIQRSPIFCFKRNNSGRIAVELVKLLGSDNAFARVNYAQFLFSNNYDYGRDGHDYASVRYRAPIFIEQVEIKQRQSGPVLVYADTTVFQAQGFQIFTSYGRHECLPPPQHCACIRLEPPSMDRLLLMIAKESVLVVFSGGNRSFALSVDHNHNKGISIALHSPADALAVGTVDEMTPSFKSLPPTKQIRDRSSVKLLSGHTVSAALRKRLDNQRLDYFIVLNFD